MLQIPASRTRTSAHLRRNFGSGLDVAFSFPLLTRKESTAALYRLPDTSFPIEQKSFSFQERLRLEIYSYRKATIGSTRMARRAGM